MDNAYTTLLAQKIRAFADAPGHHALREHQVEMLHAIADHLEKGETSGTLKAATGTGKTYALGAMAVASDEPTVIITPRNIIGDQTIKTFFDPEKFDLNVRDKVGIYDGQQPDFERETALNKKILITTYASFIRLVKSGKISADPKSPNFRRNIILDEAHRATGFQSSRMLKPFMRDSVITAWTATDQFIDGSNVDERLFDKPNRIYTLELADAVRRGLLTDAIHAISVEVGVNAADIERQKNFYGDYTAESVEKFATMKAVQEHAVDMYMHYVHPETQIPFKDLPCIVTTQGVRAAEQTAKRFNDAMGKGTAVMVSGETPKDQLRNKEHTGILDRFDHGEIKVLCASDLLIEGFDSLNASLVFSLRPSVSPWLVEQMLGRGARKQGEDYFDRFGHDKQTFAVNFFGQGMQPRLFSDIIQATSVVTTRHVPRGPQTKNHKPVREAMPHMEVPIRTFATTTELASLKNEWATRRAPDQPDNMLSFSKFRKETGISQEGWRFEKLRAIFADCEKQFNDPERKGKPVMYEGTEVNCGYFFTGSFVVFCIDKVLQSKFDTLAEKPKEMLPFSVFFRQAHAGPMSKEKEKMRAAFAECEKQFNDPQRKGPVMYEGKEIQCGRYRNGTHHDVFCLHESHIPLFVNVLPEKPAHVVSLSGMNKEEGFAVHSGSKTGAKLIDLFRECERQFDDPGREGKPVVYEGMEISCGRYRNRADTSFCIDKKHIPQIEEMLLRLGITAKPKPDDMYGFLEFCRENSIHSQRSKLAPRGQMIENVFKECERQFDDPKRGTNPVIYKGVEVSCGRFYSGRYQIFCLHKDMAKKLNLVLKPRPDHMLPAWYFMTEAHITPHPGAPRGDAIRTIFDECQRQFDDKNRQGPVTYQGIEVNCGHYKRGVHELFCVDRKHIKAFSRIADETLALIDAVQPKHIKPKSIKPDADHIQHRDGRKRQ
jgi:superfamily II DNA or RNA helicase